MKKRLLTVIAATASLLGLVACGTTPTSNATSSATEVSSVTSAVEVTITLDQTEKKCEPGDNFFLKATVTPSDTAVTWKSSDEKVATVNTAGRVTAVADGTATITATAGGKSATCTVTVKSKEITKINTITGATDDAVIVQGKVAALTTNGYYVWDGTGYMFSYDSTNTPAIGDLVQLTGKIVAYYGTLEFSSPDFASVSDITVADEPAATELTGALVDEISTAATADLYKYTTLYTWKATAGKDGSYTLFSPEGTDVKVEPYKAPSSFTFTEGKDYQITAIFNCWNNSSSYVGMALVSATEVVYEVESIAVTADAASVRVAETLQLTATPTPAKAETTYTWASSDTTKATVDENGLVTGVAEGEVTITATSANGKTATITLTIAPKAATPVSDVTLTGVTDNAVTLKPGHTATVTATVSPEDANQSVSWATSDETVATVENGVITAVAAGTATITVTSLGDDANGAKVTKTIAVTVEGFELSDLDTETGTVTVTATVTGLAYNGFIIDDGKASVYVYTKNYNGTAYTATVGDVITVTGAYASYKQGAEFIPTDITVNTGATAYTPAATELTETKAAEFATYLSDSTKPTTKVTGNTLYKVDGVTLGGSGNYLTFSVGSTQLETTNTSVSLTSGKTYDLEFYVYGYYSPYVTVIVTKATETVGIVSVSGTNTVEIGGTTTLTASTTGYDTDTYTWTSSDETIATVADGVVTGVAAGEVTITATSATSGKSATSTVTVKAGKTYTYTELEKFDFTSTLTAYEAYDSDKMDAFIKGSSSLGDSTNYVSHDKTNAATDPLIGGNGTIDSVDWSDYNCLKLGSTKKNSLIKLTFKDTVSIGKVELKAFGWYGKTCKLAVNDSGDVDITSAADSASITDGSAYQDYTFTFTPSNEVTLSSTLAVLISEMTFYTATEVAE